ncbi:MAG: ATP-dependent helicase [Actinomycetota bacterium]
MSVHPAIAAALRGFEPSEEQQRAIEYAPLPMGIIAGAGSGKTAVMAARIAHLVVSGAARPAQILGLTFTNKAAAELRERIDLALVHLELPPGEEASVFTYHGFADRVLRDYGPKIGIEPETALLTEAQAHMLVGRLLEEVTFEHLRATWLPSLIAKVRGLSESCANHLCTPQQVLAADTAMAAEYERQGQRVQTRLQDLWRDRPDLCTVVDAYIERKRELGRIDYGDQIAFAHKVVAERPEVAQTLRERWPFVLLDEYQDTNIAQRKMMEAVYPPGSAITVVGDPDQAIHAWRGATLHNILAFPTHFAHRDGSLAATYPLEVSYRSGRRILEVANAIISAIPSERRGGEKVLRHFPPTGEGEVTCDLVASEVDEARLVAEEIARGTADASGAPVPYSEIAILCRGRRLFPALAVELRRAKIPVEIVGLGGLLSVPEVVDLRAYLRLVVDPADNISFARIAMGPRWRIHYRDMAALARWAAKNTGALRAALEERAEQPGEVDPGTERFSLSEAAGRVDEIDDLSAEAAERVRSMHADIERMRASVRGATLGEAIERILAASGIEDELAVAGTDVARAARANLASFLDGAAAFSPLEGEASLGAFLEYLAAADETEDLEVAQPQQDDAVKLMTIHQAKGLEFDVVFIPGMAKGIFPNDRVEDNPFKSMTELPYTLREDRSFLPSFDKVMSRFEQALKERAMEEERRLAYVALTRARKVLRLSAAHWYGECATPSPRGRFFEELAGAPATEDADERPAHPAVQVRRTDPAPAENPIRQEWARRAEGWPRADGEVEDALFASGWRAAAERAAEDPEAVREIASAARVDRGAFEKERELVAQQLEIVSLPGAPPKVDDRLTSLSVSSLVQMSRCPKQFYWTIVRPLPRRPSRAARLGQEIHRWIEIRAIGQQRLDDPEEPPDLAPEEVADVPSGTKPPVSTEDLKRAFESSRYAALSPRYTEQPFVIALDGGYLVRGRIDAIYVHHDGSWEIVDYKTGNEPDADDPTSRLQLAIYAIAARQVWGVDLATLKLTYFYLKTGKAEPMLASELTTTEADLLDMFTRVEARAFEPTPSAICDSCDFLGFCDAGRAFTAVQHGATRAPLS